MEHSLTRKHQIQNCELIIGNSNPRFSGVTSTMLQTLAHQKTIMNVRVLGKHHLADQDIAISYWQAIKHLRAPLANNKFRIFHARRNDEMLQALFLKHVFGIKIKIVFTSTAQRHHTKFTQWLIRKMDAVISTCAAAAQYLENPPEKIISHGIQTSIYTPSENKSNDLLNITSNGTLAVGIFGRVRKQKGTHLFVQACINTFHELPNAVGVIVGATSKKDQNFQNKLQAKIKLAGLEDRIVFLGERQFEEIPGIFKAMSLVTALSNNEGFGLTVLEAMSSGVAVLATDAGAWREIIRENIDGNVIAINDELALTQKLLSLLKNEKRLISMGQQGRIQVLKHYTVEREASELCSFFQTLQ